VFVVSALLSAAHSHGSNEALDLVGWFSRTPISVIANPDLPSPDQHWHPGTASDQDPCAVCMLSHQPGFAGCWSGAGAIIAATWAAGTVPLPHVDRFACPPGARAPPSAC